MKRLLFGFLLVGSLNALAAPTGLATLIDREITKLAALYADGFGYNDKSMRHVTFGSLFGAERQAAVAFFSLAGIDNSNVHFEYIAIFAQGLGRDMSAQGGPKERPFHLVTTAMVGGRGTRTLNWATTKISKGQIVVQGTRWGKGDAGCCPTQPIEVIFHIPEDVVEGFPPKQYPVLVEIETPAQSRQNKASNSKATTRSER